MAISSINKKQALPHNFNNNKEITAAELNANFKYLEDIIRAVASDPILADRVVKLLDIGKGWKGAVSSYPDLLALTNNEDGDVRLVKTGNGAGLWRYDEVTKTWISLSSRFWKEPSNTVASLPPVSATPPNENGDIRLVIDENRLYKWNGVSDLWEPLFSANLTDAVDTLNDLKAISSATLTIDEMKLVREDADLWMWDGTKWINLTPEVIKNIIENSSFEILNRTLTVGASALDRDTVDSWYISAGNTGDKNQVEETHETTLSNVKFGLKSLKLEVTNTGGGTDVSSSNPVKLYQQLNADKLLDLVDKTLSFNIWINGTSNNVKPFVVLSTDGIETAEVVGTDIQNTSVFEQTSTLLIDIPAIVSGMTNQTFDANAYLQVGVRIENGAVQTYYFDGAMLVEGEVSILPYNRNYPLEDLVDARQTKSSLKDVLGLLSDLITNSSDNLVAAINSIVTFDVTVSNSSELVSALLDSNVTTIFIKDGNYSLTTDYDIAGKILIGESREGVVITFDDTFGFTIVGDTSVSEAGTISISSGGTAVTGVGTAFSVTDEDKYIFIGSKTYGGTESVVGDPYLILGAPPITATTLSIATAYNGPTISGQKYFISGLALPTGLFSLTLVGSKSAGIIDGFGVRNSVFESLTIKDDGTGAATDSGINIEVGYKNVYRNISIDSRSVGMLLTRPTKSKIDNLRSANLTGTTPVGFTFARAKQCEIKNIEVAAADTVEATGITFITESFENRLSYINVGIFGTALSILSNSHHNYIYHFNADIREPSSTNASINIFAEENHLFFGKINQDDLGDGTTNAVLFVSTKSTANNLEIDVTDVTAATSSVVLVDGQGEIHNTRIDISNTSGTAITAIDVNGADSLVMSNSIAGAGSEIKGIDLSGTLNRVINNIIDVGGTGISTVDAGSIMTGNLLKNCTIGVDITSAHDHTIIGNKFDSVTTEINGDTTADFIWNDPEIANANNLYTNRDWHNLNKIRNFPFDETADLDNGSNSIPQGAIFGMFLFSCDIDKEYYISRIHKDTGSPQYDIEITEDGTGVVATYSATVTVATSKMTPLSAVSGQVVGGGILIDWSLIAEADESYALADTKINPDLCLTIGPKQWEESNEERNYPFKDSATYSTIPNNLFRELLLFSTTQGESYYVSSILNDVTGSSFAIEIRDGSNVLVSEFSDTVQPTGLTLFTQAIGQSVVGFADIDWSLLADSATPLTFTVVDTPILDKNLIKVGVDVFEWIFGNKLRNFPFTDSSNMTNGDEPVGKNYIWSGQIFGASEGVDYFISRIKTGQMTQRGDTTSGSAIVTNLADTAELNIGDGVSGSGIPAGTTVLTIDSPTQITLDTNATATATDVVLTFGIAESGDTTSGSAVITNIGDTSSLQAGNTVNGSGIPAGSKILTVDGPTQITMDTNATATASSVDLIFGIVFYEVTASNDEGEVAQWSAVEIPANDYIFLSPINNSAINGYLEIDLSLFTANMFENYSLGDLDFLNDVKNFRDPLTEAEPGTLIVKTSDYTVLEGDKGAIIGVDSTVAAITITLPSDPQDTFFVTVKDIGNNAFTNFITISGNGREIDRSPLDYQIVTDGDAVELTYSQSISQITGLTGDTTISSAVITNISDTSNLAVGMLVTGSDIPDGARISSIDSATQITLDANATATNAGTSLVFDLDGYFAT